MGGHELPDNGSFLAIAIDGFAPRALMGLGKDWPDRGQVVTGYNGWAVHDRYCSSATRSFLARLRLPIDGLMAWPAS